MRAPVRVALTVVALTAGAVACDGDDTTTGDEEPEPTPVSREVVTAAAGETVAAGSATVDGEVGISLGEPEVEVRLDGVANFQTGAGVITLTFSSTEGPPIALSEFGTVEIRSIDRSTAFANYDELPGVSLEMPWVSFTAADVGATPQNFAGGDPLAALDLLQAVVGRPLQGETIDGFPGENVTRYDVELDLERLLEPATMATLDPSTLAQIERITELVDRPIGGQVFIDPEGRITQFQYSFRVEVEGEPLDVTSRVTFRDFGTAVSVEPPPPEQVQPYSAVADELGELGEGPLPVPTGE